jgi:hypothetical protein
MKTSSNHPPPTLSELPIIHSLHTIYKTVYALGPKLSKRDRYGIYIKLESLCLDALSLATEAALIPRNRKAAPLEALGIKIELVKQLVRIAHEIGAIEQRRYITLAEDLVEASKMTAGWLNYTNS